MIGINGDLRERERDLNKISRAFTLVEMLIIVVIIGILSVALIPRLTSYMARTRDLKRQSDLRNIAVAIEMYKNDYGEFPRRGEIYSSYPSASPYVGSVGGLSSVLSEYLKNPKRS